MSQLTFGYKGEIYPEYIKNGNACQFITNKYCRWYVQIVDRARTRLHGDGMERHHIVPRSLGGGNGKENLVSLTFREHFIAHHLLTKCTEGAQRVSMLRALACMRCSKQGRALNSRQFEVCRKALSEAVRGRPSKLKGRPKSAETRRRMSAAHAARGPEWREKISVAARNRSQETRALLSKRATELSPETRAKRSEAASKRKHTAETRAKLSAGMKGHKRGVGRKLSEETKAKIGAASRNRSPEANARIASAQRENWARKAASAMESGARA